MATRRTRSRKSKFDREAIAHRVVEFANKDIRSRDLDRDLRLQRYAKFRGWVEGKDWPWENASDVPFPDMSEKSLRIQDTLHNAVMSQRPPIGSKALSKQDKEKQSAIDHLIDHQFFVDREGETLVGDMADAFVNDGVMTVLIPWVKERREIVDIQEFPPIPDELLPAEYFTQIIKQQFREPLLPNRDGWDWKNGDTKVSFYTTDGKVEMVTEKKVVIFDGPVPQVYDYDDVCHPPRVANLQIPGPSNKGGSSHCIFIDHPSIDEIRRLAKSGFYDQITKDELDMLAGLGPGEDSPEEVQRDDIAGVTNVEQDVPGRGARNDKDIKSVGHNRLTRYLCFDTFDWNGDGVDEDVIWWVLRENKILLKAKALTEMYPSNPPRRPIAEAQFMPVRGRRTGISLLEQLEGLHDAIKMLLDQTIDAGTASIAPPWFYRAAGGLKPEIIRLSPGEGYPLGDPNRDVNFPKIGDPQAQGMGLNLATLLEQKEERLAVIGDLQFGRVPPGKSSALRNASSIALLSGQGEARPERILRRFFIGLSQVWRQMHELNQVFLPKGKQYLISTAIGDQDPYQSVDDKNKLSGKYQFTFSANVLNTSKQALQGSLETMLQAYLSPLFIQLGITRPDGAYRLARDFGIALGQDPDKYLSEPAPGAKGPFIQAEDAIQTMMDGRIPNGSPAEGAVQHFQKLQAFIDPNQNLLQGEFKDPEGNPMDEFGLINILNPDALPIFGQYMQDIQKLAEEELQQQQLQEAAQQFQSGQGGEGGRPPAGGQPDESPPPISGGNELIDESLPTAQGRLQ